MKKQLPGIVWSFILVLTFFLPGNSHGAEDQKSASISKITALVNDYCISCHGADKKKGDLDFEMINLKNFPHPEVWEKVVRKLRARQMPPAEKKHRPEESEYKAVLSDLESSWIKLPLNTQTLDAPIPCAG